MPEVCVEGTVDKVIFSKDNFYIIALTNGTVAKGEIVESGDDPTDIEGIKFKLHGKWVATAKYGDQFVFYHAIMKTNPLYFFLSKIVAGIGESMARDIINMFGDDTEYVINNTPEKLKDVYNIGEKRLGRILASWEEYKYLLELSKFLSDFNVTQKFIIKIYNELGKTATERIKENPYILATISGVGFIKADNIALKMGIKKDSPFRIISFVAYLLDYVAQMYGHTYITIGQLQKTAEDKINQQLSKEFIIDCLNNEYNTSIDILDQKYIIHKRERFFEDFIYSNLYGRINNVDPNIDEQNVYDFIKQYEDRNGITFGTKQKEAVVNAVKYQIYGITGYAGSGKTFVTKVILEFLSNIYNRDSIAGCAMSGIAARRFSSASGFQGFTIHALLGYNKEGFKYNKDNPLPYDVVVLDEASMVNNHMFYQLCSALSPKTKFIIIGDNAQLPPIGAGDIFNILLKHNIIHYSILDKIYRQADGSVINIYASQIRKGYVPKNYNGNTHYSWYYDAYEVDEYIKNVIDEHIPQDKLRDNVNKQVMNNVLNYISDVKIKDILTDLQVLVPMRKGVLGVENLNIELQKILNNPDLHQKKDKIVMNGKIFCVGDKVVHLKNQDMSIQDSLVPKRIYNGTLGIIQKIDYFNRIVVVRTNIDVVVIYDFLHMGDIVDLAYALTVHKAQGSEFKEVVLPLSNSQYIMLNNSWLYTAVTRAKERLNIFGEEKAFKIACKTISKDTRQVYIDMIINRETEKAKAS